MIWMHKCSLSLKVKIMYNQASKQKLIDQVNADYPLDFRDVLDLSQSHNFVESFSFLQVYFILSMRNRSALLYKAQIGNLEEANILVLQGHF